MKAELPSFGVTGSESIAGCSQLGHMYYSGAGVSQDQARGVALMRRGCAGGDDLACFFLENEGIPETEP